MQSEFASRLKAYPLLHIRKRTALARGMMKVLRDNKLIWDTLFILFLALSFVFAFLYLFSTITAGPT